jgi:hypothetical protein
MGLMMEDFEGCLKVMIGSLNKRTLGVILSGGNVGNSPSKTQILKILGAERLGIIGNN